MGIPVPKSNRSRLRRIPSGDPDLEDDFVVVEPGEPGYEEADMPSETNLLEIGKNPSSG